MNDGLDSPPPSGMDFLMGFCPEAPSWTVDWAALTETFAWVRNMAGCPQDPVYHAEGDVLGPYPHGVRGPGRY